MIFLESFNQVDLIVIAVVIYAVWRGYRNGFIAEIFNVVSTILALLLAIVYYPQLADFFVKKYSWGQNLAAIASFFAILIIAEVIFSFLLSRVYASLFHFILRKIKPLYFLDKVLGVFPSLGVALFLLSLILLLPVILPFSLQIKKPIENSLWGKTFLPYATKAQPVLEKLLKRLPSQNLLYLITTKPDSQDSLPLTLPTSLNLSVDETAEARMLELLNREREKAGLKALKADIEIREVARAHSKDMFERRYFSHYTPESLSPFDRMEKGGIEFLVAGENLAYAPSVEIAHQGLMNSPGHRENILRAEFGRVGIGVISGGIYGMMFTQNFAD